MLHQVRWLVSKRLRIILQLIISIVLLVWLARLVNWLEFRDAISRASLMPIVAACALYYIGVFISCYKWQLALRLESEIVSIRNLVGWYLIGAFSNNFLPTDVGGDLSRGYFANRVIQRPFVVSRSIIVERFTGLMAMICVASVKLIERDDLDILVIVTLSLLGLISCALVMRIGILEELRHKIQPIINQYRHQPIVIAQIIAISLGFQILAAGGTWLNLHAMHVEIPFLTIVWVTAFVNVLGVLPISINGWGVRESTIVHLLIPFGAPASGVLAAALLGRGLLLVVSSVGIVPLMFEQRRSSALRKNV